MNLVYLYFCFVAIWLNYNCFVSLQDFECEHPGFSCDCANLTVVYYCYNEESNQPPDVVDTCDSPQVCVESSEGCSEEPNTSCPENSNFTMECTSKGTFPDPYDCHGFYNCEEDTTDTDSTSFVAQHSVCPEGKGYDPETYNCNLELNSKNKCSKQPIPTCTKLTTPQQIASNPPMYYMCTKSEDGTYQPKFTLCLENQIFTSTGCINSTNPNNTTSSTPSTPNITDITNITTVPTISTAVTNATTTAPNTCQKGDTFIPDANDCRYYYNCRTSATSPSREQCPSGTSFNKKLRWCQVGTSNCV